MSDNKVPDMDLLGRVMDLRGQNIQQTITNQEPLNKVYESSDFNQGIIRGRYMERLAILSLLESIDEYPQGWDYNDPIQSIIDIIKGKDK